jgi:hypothetical protein
MVNTMSTAKKIIKVVCIASVGLSLSGCVGTIAAGLTISDFLTAGSIGSTILTGKGLGEHALDIATEKDCRIIEGIFRSDREVCEYEGSIATEDDFKGLVALIDDSQPEPYTDSVVFALKRLENAENKIIVSNSKKSLLKTLKPVDRNTAITSNPVFQKARVQLTRSMDNYAITLVSDR